MFVRIHGLLVNPAEQTSALLGDVPPRDKRYLFGCIYPGTRFALDKTD